MKESLEFYKQLSDDNKKRLDEALKRSDYLEEEVKEFDTLEEGKKFIEEEILK